MGNLVGKSPFISILIAYAGGFLTSLTPCVYPLIPVIMGICGTRETKNWQDALKKAIVFVVGMAIVYTILGLFASLTGRLFGRMATHPITLLVVGNIFIFLSLGMFGLYEIRLPVKTQGLIKRRGWVRPLLTGMVSGIVVGPCAAPVLGGILTLVTVKREILWGTSLLFSFSLGMGTLFLIVGTFSGVMSKLPKSGRWQMAIQKFFGVLLLGVGEYFIWKAGLSWW